VQLQLKTWQFVEDYLKSKTGIIIPIGSTEQHGPTGLIGTDALTAEMIGRGVGEKVGALVAPTISVGMAQHHLAFPGSMTLKPSTLIALIRDQVMSLARHGFTRFYFLNGHGGNVASIEAAFSEIYADYSFRQERAPFALKLKNWWDLKGVMGLANQQFPVGHGSHATPSEIAVTQWAYPDSIKTAAYEPRIAPTGPIREALDFRARYADGRMGSDPAQATPEKGGALVAQAARALIEDLAEFSAEKRI